MLKEDMKMEAYCNEQLKEMLRTAGMECGEQVTHQSARAWLSTKDVEVQVGVAYQGKDNLKLYYWTIYNREPQASMDGHFFTTYERAWEEGLKHAIRYCL